VSHRGLLLNWKTGHYPIDKNLDTSVDTAADRIHFPDATVRPILLARQIPPGWQQQQIGSPVFRRHINVGFGPPQRLSDRSPATDQHTVVLLSVPDSATDARYSLQQPAAALLTDWVAETQLEEDGPPQVIQLQGVLMCAGSTRIAVSGSPERMQAVTGAVVEHFWLQSEIRRLEQQTADRWQELEEDTPAAFELTEPLLERRQQLQQRFQLVIAARATLTRLAPLIDCPAVWPPTLASQASERLREKSRLPDRLQILREQLEVYEQVYEQCGQRLSDFSSSRKSQNLEWIIIVLLAAELLLLVVDLLSSLSETT